MCALKPRWLQRRQSTHTRSLCRLCCRDVKAHIHTYTPTYIYTHTQAHRHTTRIHTQKWEGRTGLSRPRTGATASIILLLYYEKFSDIHAHSYILLTKDK